MAADVTRGAREAPVPPRSARDRTYAPERCARVSWSLLDQWVPQPGVILSVERGTRCSILRATIAKQAHAANAVWKVRSIPGGDPADSYRLNVSVCVCDGAPRGYLRPPRAVSKGGALAEPSTGRAPEMRRRKRLGQGARQACMIRMIGTTRRRTKEVHVVGIFLRMC
jgi:hypothetical protein